ncbi:MAG: type II secretion system protein [bacterium]|nr:type II secretion system protein [bacterium]
MFKSLKSLKSSKKGFTLIELLVVIAIIGILSSVVLASLSTAREKSRDAKRISDVGQIQLALELFFDSVQSYPSTTPTCVGSTPLCAGDDAAVELVTVSGFLPQRPLPPAGSAAVYAYKGVISTGATCTYAGTGNACVGYALGIDLERTDNVVLAVDAEQIVDDGSNDFYGSSGTTCVGLAGAAGAGPEACYDVKP